MRAVQIRLRRGGRGHEGVLRGAAAEGTMPAFFVVVVVTLKLCPGGAAAGGSVIAVTTRSGKASTVIFSAVLRQLLFSSASSDLRGAVGAGLKVIVPRGSAGGDGDGRHAGELAVSRRESGDDLDALQILVVVFPPASRSENLVVDAGASAAPRFLIVAVTAKLSPGSAVEGGFVSAVTTRSGSLLAASAAPELPRSRPATARPQPSRPEPHCPRIRHDRSLDAPADFAPGN